MTMIVEALNGWNPWWRTEKVPEALKGIERDIDPIINKSLDAREIIILTGIRRSGKTTIMYQLIDRLLHRNDTKQILYANLDDEALKSSTLEDIYNAYRQDANPEGNAYFFLDEIQNMEGWERFLKKHYDMRDKVKFVISGSTASLLKKEYSTLLTGRNLTYTIWPLSFKEFLRFSKTDTRRIDAATKNAILHHLGRYMLYGGFPEVCFKDEELKEILLKQYFDDMIYKDVISRHDISPHKVNELAVYLLTNMANPYTIRSIRNITGLSIDSIRDYLAYLEDAYLITSTEKYSDTFKETIKSPRKVYITDTGLRNAAGRKFSPDTGRLAENIAAMHLKAQNKKTSYHKNGGEIDFIVKNPDQTLTAINVTYSDKIEKRETTALTEFKKENKRTKELIIITKDTEKTQDGITYVPMWKWLLEENKTREKS